MHDGMREIHRDVEVLINAISRPPRANCVKNVTDTRGRFGFCAGNSVDMIAPLKGFMGKCFVYIYTCSRTEVDKNEET